MSGIQITAAVHYLRSVATTRATFAAQCNREQQAEWRAADLIEQQAAEIERLREDNETLNEIIAIHGNEVNRLRAERDEFRAELTNLQVAFNDWKVFHSTVRLEVEIERLRAALERAHDVWETEAAGMRNEIERLRAELERKTDTAVRNKWMAEVMQDEIERLRADLADHLASEASETHRADNANAEIERLRNVLNDFAHSDHSHIRIAARNALEQATAMKEGK